MESQQPLPPHIAPNEEGVAMKHCRRCNTHKPITQFYKSKANADGYDGRCKTCDAVQCAQRRKRKERIEVCFSLYCSREKSSCKDHCLGQCWTCPLQYVECTEYRYWTAVTRIKVMSRADMMSGGVAICINTTLVLMGIRHPSKPLLVLPTKLLSMPVSKAVLRQLSIKYTVKQIRLSIHKRQPANYAHEGPDF